MTPKLQQSWNKLEEQRKSLLEKLKTESDLVLNKRTETDKWSAIQVLLHEIAIEENTKSYFAKKIPEASIAQKAGFRNTYFYFLLNVALALPKKYKAPTHTIPSSEELSLAEVEQKWIKVRAELLGSIENLSDEILQKQLFKHPAGKLSIYQAIDFMYLHHAHHKKQIFEAVREAK
jgi:hypothetical protein